MSKRYIPSITTISHKGNTWQSKIAEVESLTVLSFAIFLTGLTPTQRPEFYNELLRLRKNHKFTIPFCHAVASMTDDEFRFLSGEFGVEWFNLHPTIEYPLEHALSDEVRQKICIENSDPSLRLTKNDIEGFAGLCIDLSHLEDVRRSIQQHYEAIIELAHSYPVCANHISGSTNTIQGTRVIKGHPPIHIYSSHYSSKVEEFNYVPHLPAHVHAPIGAIELEISIKEQLIIIEHLHSNLNQRRLAA